MNTLRIKSAVALLASWIIAATSSTASAQILPGYDGPNLNPQQGAIQQYIQAPPTVNPYLNLSNPFASQTPLYQTLVQPLVNTHDQLQTQGGQIQDLRGAISGGRGAGRGAASGALVTGHSTQFMNYSHYYSYTQRGAGSSNLGGGGAAFSGVARRR